MLVGLERVGLPLFCLAGVVLQPLGQGQIFAIGDAASVEAICVRAVFQPSVLAPLAGCASGPDDFSWRGHLHIAHFPSHLPWILFASLFQEMASIAVANIEVFCSLSLLASERLPCSLHLAARLPRMLPRRSPLVLPRRRRRPIGRRIFRQKETLLLFVERLASRCWRALLLGLRTASEPLSQGERRVVESTGRHVFDTE